MDKGFLDDIPIHNIARDKAWEAFIKRKDVKHLVKHGLFDKGFPLYGGYYELWCQAWDRAWTDGFKSGYDSGWASCKLMAKKTKEKK
jgi:phage terminase large subunit-like protein